MRAQEEHEVARILAELSALAGAEAVQIRTNVAIYVDLDLALARAAVADRMNAVEPTIVDAAVIDVHEGRHPLLDERAVPQSIALDDDVRVTIISGPNMGGKTVALKMVGLFVAMAGCGMHVPAVYGDDRPLHAHLHRHRRRPVDRAEHLDVFRAPGTVWRKSWPRPTRVR